MKKFSVYSLFDNDYLEAQQKIKTANITKMQDSELLTLVMEGENVGIQVKAMTNNKRMYEIFSEARYVKDITANLPIDEEQAIKLLAGIEIGRRTVINKEKPRKTLSTPAEGANYCMHKYGAETHERFILLSLNIKNKLIADETVSEGSLNCSVVHPREAFKMAIKNSAAAIIAVHNHPSGDPHPSREDRELTSTLVSTGEIIGIPLLDHIIVGKSQYYSFKEHGEL